MAAANVAKNLGIKPVFCDVDEDTWCMSVNNINKISNKTKAIVAIHSYGNVCEMDEIIKLAKNHNIHVIAAESFYQSINQNMQVL